LDPFDAEVVENKEVAGGIFLLRLRPSVKTAAPAPGQFFMVGVGQGTDPLLRRPLGWLGPAWDESGAELLEFLYEVRGRGTQALSRVNPKSGISLIGPLGRGWRLDGLSDRVIVVAGGMGVAALLPAARALIGAGGPRIDFIFGARTDRGLVLTSELESMPIHFAACTEDGCVGEEGLVTDLLGGIISEGGLDGAVVLACGPRAMLREVARMSAEAGLACQVSLEARMACGMGACLTCSIRGADGANLGACKDGPVFDAKDIDWEALDDHA